jgi:hypothetical protein
MITRYDIYERRRVHKGYKANKKEKIDLSEKIKKFIPGSYIIFATDPKKIEDSDLVFGRILRISEYESYNDDGDIETFRYLSVHVIDGEEVEKRFRISHIIKDENVDYSIIDIQPLFITNSLKEAEEKYEEISYEWKLKKDASMYNL